MLSRRILLADGGRSPEVVINFTASKSIWPIANPDK